MSKKNRLGGLLAVPLVTILLITGCSVGSPEPTETPNPSPSISAPADPTAAPEPTEPPAPAPEETAGAVVDAATASELNSEKNGQFRGYPMPDGSYVVVDKTAPLPAPVQQDIHNKGTNHANTYTVDDGTNAFLQERQKMINEVQTNTGKRAVALLRMTGYDFNENLVTKYFFNGPYQPDTAFGSAAEAQAAAEAWIASQENPNNYVLILPE
jgi:hypothetical protein